MASFAFAGRRGNQGVAPSLMYDGCGRWAYRSSIPTIRRHVRHGIPEERVRVYGIFSLDESWGLRDDRALNADHRQISGVTHVDSEWSGSRRWLNCSVTLRMPAFIRERRIGIGVEGRTDNERTSGPTSPICSDRRRATKLPRNYLVLRDRV